MDWKDTGHGFMTAQIAAGRSLEDAMRELCDEIATYVIPANSGVDWDLLTVEIWPDSGRIIVYPASSSTPYRIEKAGCQVVFDELLLRYEALADSDIADDDFSAQLHAEEEAWIDRLMVAFKNSSVHGTTLIFRDSDDILRVEDL